MIITRNTHWKYKGIDRLRIKGSKKIYHADCKPKKAGVVTVLGKAEIKTFYDESFLWKDTIILNVFVSNNTDITIFKVQEVNRGRIKEETDKTTINWRW